MINSSSNKMIKEISSLMKKSSLRREKGLFIAEGLKIFSELDDKSIDSIYISETAFMNLDLNIKKKLEDKTYYLVSDRIFKSISDTISPQGILAICKQKKFLFEDVLSKKNICLLILETLQDPGNMGTIFRTAEAAGVDAIIMDKTSVDVYNPKVVRSAMGAISRISHIVVEDLQESINILKENGIKIYAAHLDGKKYYDDIRYCCATAFLIGNESRGLSEDITKVADELIKIPLHGKAESLNASVAAAILMYEFERQRRNG